MNHDSRRRPATRYLVDAAALFTALGLGVLGLHAAFGGNGRYLAAGLGGALLGLGLAYAQLRFRLAFLPVAGLSGGIYLVFGTLLATPAENAFGMLPTFESVRTLLAGVVLSWKDVLTVAPPVGIQGGMLIVPFLAAFACALAAGLLAWHPKSGFWAVLPVSAMFIVGICFGTKDVPLPLLRGLLLVAVLVTWLAWRHHVDRALVTRTGTGTGGPRRRARAGAGAGAGSGADAGMGAPAGPGTGRGTLREGTLRRIGMGAAVLAVAGGITALAAPALQVEGNRQVLRDAVVPPIDLFDYPSPLMKFRSHVKDQADEPLLSVTGLPEDQRIRIAALDSYDGMVFNVDPRSGGNFAPVGDTSNINASAAGDPLRARGTLGITIEGYTGVWLPGGGKLLGVDLAGDRAAAASRSLFYNADAETALGTTPLRSGDSYTATVEYPVQIGDKQLAAHDFADIPMPKLANVPQVVAGRAAEMAGDGETPLARARNIQTVLKTSGYFSNGKENEVPSLSGHGAARIAALLDAENMIGDDEQYATAMALMAREQGMPARVVLGFYPEDYDPSGTVQLTGKDAHAWVEIAFEDVGWVSFDPTPDKDKEPTPPQQEPQSIPQPQVLQPPPPPQDAARLPPETAPDPQDADEQDHSFWAMWGVVVAVVLGIAMPLVILMIPLLVIAWLKLRRRRRRFAAGAPGERVGAGWSEVLSYATDLGARPDARGTRRENARTLAGDFPHTSATATRLASRADAAVFGTAEPTEAQVADYWNMVDEHIGGMRSSLGFWARMRAKYSPRSLLLDAGAAVASRRRPRGPRGAGIRTVGTAKEKE